MSDSYCHPSKFKDMSPEQLAYKLAMMYSFVAEVDADGYLPRFERKYEDWYKEQQQKAESEKPKPVSLKPEEFTEEKMRDLWNACRYFYEKDNHDRDRCDYDLELLFDNIEEASIDFKKDSSYIPCNLTVDEYVAEQYKGELTVEEFLDKWLAIIRSKTVGKFNGYELIDKCLDMQDSSQVGCYLGTIWAASYTDDDIREFFRRCWYKL